MPRRFHREPMVQAAELLLQERVPADSPIVEASPAGSDQRASAPTRASLLLSRRLTTPATAAPRTHLLSNTRYHVMVTNAGSGYSKCQGLDVTRWREDATCEGWGQFFYVRDLADRPVLVGRTPASLPAGRRLRSGLLGRQGPVPPARRRHRDPARNRRFARTARRGPPDHPDQPWQPAARARADKLCGTVLLDHHGPTWPTRPSASSFLKPSTCPVRIPCSAGDGRDSSHEQPIWAVHVMAVDRSALGCTIVGALQFETDRARFLGRGRTPADPAAMSPNTTLSGTTRPCPRPCFQPAAEVPDRARRIGRGRLHPGHWPNLAMVLWPSPTSTTESARWPERSSWPGRTARSSTDIVTDRRKIPPVPAAGVAPALCRLRPAGSLDGARRESPGSSRLSGRYGIAGDRPIILARIAEAAELSLVHGNFWSRATSSGLKGLEFDLVLLVQEESGNTEDLRQQIFNLVRDAGSERSCQPARWRFCAPERRDPRGRCPAARGRGPCPARRSAGLPLRPA